MAQIYVTKKTRQRKNKDGSNAPQPKCEVCGITIEVGMSHKNVSVRSSYSSTTRVRCMNEPDWKPWELSSSLSARLQEVAYNFWQSFDGGFESADDVLSMLSEAAEAVKEIAEEKRESSQNIEDGFGHPTEQSDELAQQADDLESWADEIENADLPELPDHECDDSECAATEPTEDQLDEWRDEVRTVCEIVDEVPV
jgi:hypothetical protein